MSEHEVVITGLGLVCAAGGNAEASWDSLNSLAELSQPSPIFDCRHYPIRESDVSKSLDRSADRRQIGNLMLYGMTAAAQALDGAQLYGPGRANLQMCIALSSGERDLRSDEAVLAAGFSSEGNASELNSRLMRIRPSLYLAQLPNLLGANIGIAQNLSIPSRTFMGSEPAGLEALRHVYQRVGSGHASIFLTGSAKNSECVFSTILAAENGWLSQGICNDRGNDAAGYVLGSAGAFLVVESKEHACTRGATPLARIAFVTGTYHDNDGQSTRFGELAERLLAAIPKNCLLTVISGSADIHTSERLEGHLLSLMRAKGMRVRRRVPARALGHSVEASVFVNTALGVQCLQKRNLFRSNDSSDADEDETSGPLEYVLITCWGSSGGYGMALLERRV
jgi:3-oxoacyl-[acyl-carrier-protein] synthase II